MSCIRSQTKGSTDLKRIASNCIGPNIIAKYITMASVACLMKYVEFSQGVYIANSTVKIEEKNTSQRLMMDSATIAALELIRSVRNGSEQMAGVLFFCSRFNELMGIHSPSLEQSIVAKQVLEIDCFDQRLVSICIVLP